MAGKCGAWWLVLALMVAFTEPAGAGDASACGSARWSACPPSNYSCLNFLAPTLFRVRAHVQRDGAYLHAVDAFPEAPLHYQAVVFSCPAVATPDYPYVPYILNPYEPDQRGAKDKN